MGPHCLSLYLTLLNNVNKICSRRQKQTYFSDENFVGVLMAVKWTSKRDFGTYTCIINAQMPLINAYAKVFCMFNLILYVPVNNLSVMSERVFLG